MRIQLALAFLALIAPSGATAQGAAIPFGGLSHDSSLPVEITADELQLDQATGRALFSGAVRVVQGDLRMGADRIEVFYVEDAGSSSGQVQKLVADGNVTLSNGLEAAESEAAIYEVATGVVTMTGDVLLTQGNSALSSETLKIDLNKGTGVLDGRVKTIFQPEANQ